MISSIYLAGNSTENIVELSQLCQPDWRFQAMSTLQKYGLRVVNPLDLSFAVSDLEGQNDKNVRRSLELIDQSDAILANLFKPNYGTAMEIFYAHRRGKMVTVIGQSPFNPWVLSHSDACFQEIEQALEYLIEECPQLDPVSWACQYEAMLAQRYEELPPDGEPDYKFIGGELPVLFVAPRSTAYFRDGEFLEPDAFTGSSAALLNRLSRAHSMIANFCLAQDPCTHLSTPFCRALSDVVKAGKIGMVVFLLGSSWHETPGLRVSSYGPDAGFAASLSQVLRAQLSKLEPIASAENEDLSLPLVNYLVHEMQTNVLVLRMHKRYRMPRLKPELFARLIDIVGQFSHQMGLEFFRKQA